MNIIHVETNLVASASIKPCKKRVIKSQLHILRQPCWILSSPRTGSSYLSNLLECTNLFRPRFAEWYDTPNVRKFAIPKILPRFCKVHRPQIEHWNVDLDNLDKNLPGIRFIHISRKDKYSQAISYYFAHYSKFWAISKDEDLECFQKIDLVYNQKVLSHLVNWLADSPDLKWDGFLKNKQ